MGTEPHNTRQCVSTGVKPEVLWALSRREVSWRRELDLIGHRKWKRRQGKNGNDTRSMYPGNTFLSVEKQISSYHPFSAS